MPPILHRFVCDIERTLWLREMLSASRSRDGDLVQAFDRQCPRYSSRRLPRELGRLRNRGAQNGKPIGESNGRRNRNGFDRQEALYQRSSLESRWDDR